MHLLVAVEAQAGLAQVSVAAVDAPKAALVEAEPTEPLAVRAERLPQLHRPTLQPQNRPERLSRPEVGARASGEAQRPGR